MATKEETLARMQEIANRGLQDKLPEDKRAIFDEAVGRGLIKVEAAPMEKAPPAEAGVISFPGSGVLEMAKNVPRSGLNYLNDIGMMLRHPLETAQGLGNVAFGVAEKFIPGQQRHESYADQIGSYLKDRFGGLDRINNTAITDPVGAVGDLSALLTGGGSLARVAGTSAKLAPLVDAGVKTAKLGAAVDPILLGYQAGAKAGDLTGRFLGRSSASMFGLGIGKGQPAVEAAFRAGRVEPTRTPGGQIIQDPSADFRNASKGNLTPEEMVGKVDNALKAVEHQQTTAYTAAKGKLPQRAFDGAKLTTEIEDIFAKRNIGIELDPSGVKPDKLTFKDVGIGKERGKLNSTFKELRAWEDFSTDGLIRMKQNIGDKIKWNSVDGQTSKADGILKEIYHKIDDTLVETIPEYRAMNSEFSLVEGFQREVTAALGAGKKGSLDTAFNKIQRAIGQGGEHKNNILRRLETEAGVNLEASLAGLAAQDWFRQGVLGGAFAATAIAQLGSLNIAPWMLAGIAGTSPKLILNTAHTLGLTARQVDRLAKNLRAIRPYVEPLYVTGQLGRMQQSAQPDQEEGQ